MPEYEFSRPLGDTVKRARGELGLTQVEVADRAGMDVRTVLNIENYRGDPKAHILYSLFRTLKIDSRDVFNSELKRESPALYQMQLLLAGCSEQELRELIPIIKSVLSVLRSRDKTEIK